MIAPATVMAAAIATWCARFAATTPIRSTWSPFRATRPSSPACSNGAISERIAATPYGGGSSVVGGVEPPAGGDWRGSVSIDLTRLDRVLEVDHTSRAARIQGGVLGPSLEDQLRPHELHAPPLPAVVRIFHARRMDRDALGRSFRDALHAYRRFRGVGSRAHADRRHRVAPSARLRRRAESRPHVHRLGGNSRHHHRGLDAPAGSAEVSRRRVGRVCRFLGRRRCGARDRAGRALSGQLPPARSRARRPMPAPTRARLPCWCWPSSRPTMRWSRG